MSISLRHVGWLALAGLPGVLSCVTPTPAQPPRALAPEPSAPAILGQKLDPTPHVVVQPLLGPGLARHLLTPTRVWQTTNENGLTFVDSERDVALASFFTPFLMASYAFVPGTNDVVVSFFDPRPVREGKWERAGYGPQRVVERWSLATRVRRWSRAMAPLPDLPNLLGAMNEHVTASTQGVFYTRCRSGSRTDTCFVTKLGAEDGAPGPMEMFETGPMPPRWGTERADFTDGRLSLERGPNSPGKAEFWWIFDGTGHVRGTLHAKCARFDEQGRLLLEGEHPGTLADIEALGVETVSGGKACAPAFKEAPPPPMPFNETGIMDIARIVISGDRLVWQPGYGEREVWSLDVAGVGMPARFTLPPAAAGPDRGWWLQETTRDLYAKNDRRLIRWGGGDQWETNTLPREGFIWSSGSTLLMGYWGPKDDSFYRLSLGTRKSAGEPLKWRDLPASSIYTPGFAAVEQGGKDVVVIAGGHSGLQRVDAASGQLLQRKCETPVANGRCSHDEFIGLVASRDGKTAWTYHYVDAPDSGTAPTTTFSEVDLATGKTLRSVPARRIEFDGPDEYRAGWLEPDKQLWFAGPIDGSPCVAVVQTSGAEGEPPPPRYFCTQWRILGLQGDPAGRFFVSFRGFATLDFYAPDGTQVLLAGTRGNDSFAQSKDGRFACTGAACNELRCVVGDEVRPVSDAACQPLRVPGFSVVGELAKPR